MAFGDFTVTRASTKNVIGSNGLYQSVANNVPAFEFNTDGSYRGLLVEPGATNLALRSQEFDDAYWVKGVGGVALAPVVTANNQTAPDGTSTADTVVFSLNGGTTTSDISQLEGGSFTYVSETRTQSVFARTTDGSTVAMSFVHPDGAVQRIIITPTYQRFALASTGSATNGTLRIRLRGGGENTATTASIALWNWQFETGAVATSPIVTTGSTASRVADVVSLTGASSLIGQSEGTIVAEVQISSLLGAVGRTFLDLNAGSNNNRLFLGFTGLASNTIRGLVSANNAPVGDQRFVVSASGILKTAFAYKSSDSVLYVNGVAGSSTANSAISFTETLAEVRIGDSFGGLAQLNGHIRSISVFPTRLANATLQAITA